MKPSNVLDVGCGRGVVVEYLRAKGIDCLGVELANVEISLPLSRYVLTGLSSLSLPNIQKGSFDTLMFLDVLEHIDNPKVFLQEHVDNYKSVKYVLIALPARSELWTNYDDFYGHYQRYSFNSFKKELLLDGWEIAGISYAFRWLYPLTYLYSLFKFKRSVKINAPSTFAKPIHLFLSLLSKVDFRILPRFFWGTSIFCVIKKSEQ